MSKKFQGKNKKKGRSYLVDDILKVLSKSGRKALNYKQVAALLKAEDEGQKLLINSILKELAQKEIITEPERGKYKIAQNDQYLEGKVDMTSSGAGYIVPAEGEDIYVPAAKMLNALHGDLVKVYVYPPRPGRKPEGEVTEIIQRGRTEFVGVVQVSQRFAFLVADNAKMHVDIYIPLDKINGAKDKQKAIARIVNWPEKATNPIGEIIEVLGNPGEHEVEIHAILAEYGLPYVFPKDVEKVADLIPTKITEKDIAARRDFRHVTTFTIDPVDAKDFDDALSIQKLPNGNWEVGVHIADVTHYVKLDSIIDKEAQQRATSVYLVDRVVPMLPEVLSNNVCSLRPNEEKLCFSAVFELNDQAELQNEWFGRTVIFSDRRFTYEEAQQVIETEQGDFSDEILTFNRLAKLLKAERFKKGSIAFDKIEVRFYIDEEGRPTGVFFKQQKDSNHLIEDFMLLANRKVAEYVGKGVRQDKSKKQDKNQKAQSGPKPFVYRIHDSPDLDKFSVFSEFVGKFGYKMSAKSPKDIAFSLNKLLKDVSGKKEENMIEQLAIRTMAKAIYSTKNIGHYGLAFDHYTHFTSPIRRYPDMMVHRLLQHYLDQAEGRGGKVQIDEGALENQCKHSSDMEKLAADAERASIKYKQVEFLQDKVGVEFEGLISGVTEWGVFVEIIENKCEGMVRIKDMQDDNYSFDQDNYAIRGRRTGKVYTLGDKVKISVKRADIVRKQLDFEIVDATNRRGIKNENNSGPEKDEDSGRRRPYKPSGKPFEY